MGVHDAQVHVLPRFVGALSHHADVVDTLGHGQALIVASAAHVLGGILVHIDAHGAAGEIHIAAGSIVALGISAAAHRGAGVIGVDIHRAALEVDLGPFGGAIAAGAAADDGSAAVGNKVIIAGNEGHLARHAGAIGAGACADNGTLLGSLDEGSAGHGEGDLAVHLAAAAADACTARGLIQVQRAAAANGQRRVLGDMDVGIGTLARAVLIQYNGALNIQLVLRSGEVHQGAAALK